MSKAPPAEKATSRTAGRVTRGLRRSVGAAICRTIDRHAPDQVIKSNGLFVYGRCRFCSTIITQTRRSSWRAAPMVDDEYLAEMRAVSE
jgi:hypothetical protein